MIRMGWLIAKIRSKIVKRPKSYEIMNNYYRRGGATIGNNCVICSNLDLCEKELLIIGNNTIISSDVLFVTHDVSFGLIAKKQGSLFGKITIGNNCFIGERSTILYGVTLADNIIVGSGSVVTKSFDESGIIIAGNPAKIIGYVNQFINKNQSNSILVKDLGNAIKTSDKRLIKR